MGLASNATGRLHTPALDKLKVILQKGRISDFSFYITPLNFIQTSKTSRLITFNWSLSSWWWNRCRSQNHSSYWTALIMFHTEGHNCDDNHEEVDDKRADHHCSYPINRTSLKDLGADVLVCSAYKFFGPHLGVMAFNKERLRSLQPSKVFD